MTAIPEEFSISDTCVAKSDQLNADDIVGREVQVRILKAEKVGGEQPIILTVDGGLKPWKPCKTMRRALQFAWGDDFRAYVGRSVVLYRDPDVKWAGEPTGGVRVRAMSHIDKVISINLNASKGKKQMHRIDVLKVANAPAPSGLTLEEFVGAIALHGLAYDDVAEWRKAAEKPPVADLTSTQRQQLAVVLAPGGKGRKDLDAFLAAGKPEEETP
ncbi:MAG: hypothetical protein Q8S13_09155 [Dehalococcoidia bacterium]|nr:hypothetical protein [Dehalococcoidia bacterium]